MVGEVLQFREVARGIPWVDGDIGESEKTCID